MLRPPLRAESRQEREAAKCSPCAASTETRPRTPSQAVPGLLTTDAVRPVVRHAAQGRGSEK